MADWQGRVKSLVFGAGTNYTLTGPISGLGIPAPRGARAERGDRDGDVGGDDTLPRRILSIPLGVEATSPALCWQRFQTLKAAWRPAVVDETLELWLPGMASEEFGLTFFGRPGNLDDDLALLKSGHVDALCTFEALDPFGYGPTVDLEDQVGTFDVDNVGDADTDRAILTITGNGGTPRIENASDEGGDVTFGEPVVGTRTIDLRARTVIDGDGVDRFEELAPGMLWFLLRAGVNELTLTGAASVTVSFRPAYH